VLDYYGRSDIFLPSYLGNVEKLQELLARPEQVAYLNVGVRKQGYHTALFFACYGSANLATVMALVAAGADVYAFDNMGRIPFHIACNSADPQIVKYFIDTVPGIKSEFNAVDFNGRTPLHALCCSGSSIKEKRRGAELVESLNMLLDMYADPAAIVAALNKPDDSGLTPLMLAKFYGLDELSYIFARYGIDISKVVTVAADHAGVRYDYFGRTKLMEAAFDHDLETVQQQLERHDFSSDPNLHNPQAGYRSPLLLVCCSGAPGGTDIVAAILDDPRTDPLICDVDGSTALHFAANTGRPDVVALLLQQDQIRDNINIIDQSGMTALHALAMANSRTSMRIDSLYLLLDHGIDLFAVDLQGRTAYQVAKEHGNYAVALALYHAMRKRLDFVSGCGSDDPPKPAPRRLLAFEMQLFKNGFPNSTITESEKYSFIETGPKAKCCYVPRQ
jgi:ankyrin repeat protein